MLHYWRRGEQSLNAARSALSPEPSGAHDGHGERGATSGRDEQPGLGPSVRGIFSDLKRTMERVGEGQAAWQPVEHLDFRGLELPMPCLRTCSSRHARLMPPHDVWSILQVYLHSFRALLHWVGGSHHPP